MKKLCLLLTTLMLSACGGGSYTTTTGGNGNQNFIYDSEGNLIEGTVSLILTDEVKSDEAFASYCEGKTLTSAEKEAYKYDTKITCAKKLCDIVYDTEKTGSYSYTFDFMKTCKDIFQNNHGTFDVEKGRLILCFMPKGKGLRTLEYSDYSSLQIKIEYTYSDGGLINVSRTKSGTKSLVEDGQLKIEHNFVNYVPLYDIYYSLLEGNQVYTAISDVTLTFSGSATARIL